MSKGRRPGRITKVERFEHLTKQVEALSMATRLNQMMVQGINRRLDELQRDVRSATSMLNDFQYRLLAIQQLSNLDAAQLQGVSDTLKLVDFERELARKDLEENVAIVDTVESDDDIVVITSTTPEAGSDQGILRSRIRISEMNQVDLMAKLQGKKVGDKVETTLNEVKHVVEVLGIRRAPKPEKVEEKAS